MSADWEDRKEKVENLDLDLQNPRVPKHIKDNNDVALIRNYLIEKTDVLKIAEHSARRQQCEYFLVELAFRRCPGVLTGIDASSFSLHDDPWQFGPLASGCLDSNGDLVGNTIDENGNGWSTEDIVQPLSTLAFYVNYGGTRVKLATLVP